MRIAIIIPHIGDMGGGQKVIAKIAYYLKQKGHKVEFFTPSYDKNSPYKEFHKLKVNLIKPKSKFLYRNKGVLNKSRLKNELIQQVISRLFFLWDLYI